ncbi:phosphonatase-like hydrolase [Paeniglutamicibacter cryotolerans]|uniref:Phosphonatase-like hydrolase n=1 Tax=Paeniglutamicibacter cryotolerans TaxID=670079 RepID=A0A839QSQ2_9MICC|nr:phosphonatase-like hydrolase [Paeniglutamicibacter cryotolerans]MBB2995071.1 phosphonatase-like hydrolase [Paeniglutamicibacter cryotolerans]
MVQLITLDVAGTTVNEGGAVYASLKAVIEEALSVTISEEQLRPALGANKREAIAGFLTAFTGEADPEEVERLYELFRLRLTRSYAENPPVELPGVGEAIDRMRAAGMIVALTTGFSRSISMMVLDSLGWSVGPSAEDRVDFLITSDDVDAGRPAPDMIRYAMRLAGVSDPAQVLAAGDTERDLAAGMNAGAKYVVAVATGAQSGEHLSTFPHTHLCDVRDLPELLGVSEREKTAAP